MEILQHLSYSRVLKPARIEPKLIEFLQLIYRGRKLKPDTFEKLIGHTFEDLDERYEGFLTVDTNRVAKFLSLPLTRNEMALPGSELKEDAFDALGRCENLEWIDLSGNIITVNQVKRLAGCEKLGQIILTQCPLEVGSLKALSQFPQLTELDFSGSSITDQALTELRSISTLTSLRLISTRVTDAGLEHLAGIKNLKLLDVSNCRVSSAGIARLKARLPGLQVVNE